jgi:hypothetical protein
MSGWFSKSLGDAMLAGEVLEHIESLFRAECAKAGPSSEMAIFIRHESEGRLHCEVKAYFAPASAAVAREVDADPCERPSPQGLSLLVGGEDVWAVLFPERC